MHFTREPIIESILSARDGYKLVLKNSKTPSSSEISSEVIEIVSFSGTVFYRSQDRSRNFLLPATDFEIVEVKDSRLVLKNISLDKSSKLPNPPREQISDESADEGQEDQSSSDQDIQAQQTSVSASQNSRLERRRERRRNRRRRHNEEKNADEKRESASDTPSELENHEEVALQSETSDEGSSTSMPMLIPTLNLIPPPTTLISQTLARYKEKQPELEAPVQLPIVEEVSENKTVDIPLEPEDLV